MARLQSRRGGIAEPHRVEAAFEAGGGGLGRGGVTLLAFRLHGDRIALDCVADFKMRRVKWRRAV